MNRKKKPIHNSPTRRPGEFQSRHGRVQGRSRIRPVVDISPFRSEGGDHATESEIDIVVRGRHRVRIGKARGRAPRDGIGERVRRTHDLRRIAHRLVSAGGEYAEYALGGGIAAGVPPGRRRVVVVVVRRRIRGTIVGRRRCEGRGMVQANVAIEWGFPRVLRGGDGHARAHDRRSGGGRRSASEREEGMRIAQCHVAQSRCQVELGRYGEIPRCREYGRFHDMRIGESDD